jgi:endonuclease-3
VQRAGTGTAESVNPQKRRQIFERLRAANPHPQSELAHRTPFELLVAVVLSAQATDKGVNKATAKLFPVAHTPAAIAALGVDGLIPYVQSIGLFRNKAKNIVALSQILLREHGGEVPANREALEKLPGVGRKTANVVLNVAFGQPTIAVDTHIFRVANRMGSPQGRTPTKRAEARQVRAGRIPAARAPLADPARALRLQRAEAGLRRVPAARSLRIPRQDGVGGALFNPSRDEARRFLIEAWRKHRAQEPSSGLERIAADLVAQHPEYHAVLEDLERNLDRDWQPEHGDVNPFLHLSLHLAVADSWRSAARHSRRVRPDSHGERRRARRVAHGARMSGGGYLERTAARHAAGWRALPCLPRPAAVTGNLRALASQPLQRGVQCFAATVAGCAA